jgi:sulfonate transport system ATP-binding protein
LFSCLAAGHAYFLVDVPHQVIEIQSVFLNEWRGEAHPCRQFHDAQPEVLLLDEPFSALDAFTRRDLQDHLLDLWADTRPTLVLVTHDVDEAVVLADRALVMRPRPGRLFEEIKINLARPRDRNSPLFDNFKRRVLTALDRSLDRNVPDREAKSNAGEAMWW